MMKVWLLDSDPHYGRMEFVEWDDREKVYDWVEEGKVLSEDWTPLAVKFDENGEPSDFLANINGALIVSSKTKEVLSQIPGLPIEFLPLQSDDSCYIMNVLTVLDCIDYDNSKKYQDTERVDQYSLSLYEEIVSEHDIFRMKAREGEQILGYSYVSDRLKKLIEDKLVGWQLVEIWDSEFSWQQQEAQHEAMCKAVNDSLIVTFDFGKASKYVEKNKGALAYSGKWALRVDENNDTLLGRLLLDGTYEWSNPIYYPPIILYLTWGIKEKKEKKISFVSMLKNLISFK
ncbi:imm11 family protein [Paenibacillus agilis]|uniref:Immunity MXAN-0049 protein domain-containing protein n=1 Tax=Paenibacillus agilis TaxID=3020863 RepID=A0A559IWA8_9BACL|nr:DUF1629 domain-containing protein [Paenibacillus agilis]TVX91925.1 hypothetical protein FPZ44_01935 [Paenibacillus agilis]